MRSENKLEELRFKKYPRTAFKAKRNNSADVSALRHFSLVKKPQRHGTSSNEFDRIDLLACFFGSGKIG